MGMPPWTEKRIEWYQRAVSWNDFDKVLVDKISRFIPKDETVCDMGCGTGFVAMELAYRGYETTAFDMNEVTMKYLREEVSRRGLNDKLRIQMGSWNDLKNDSSWDNIIMVQAGNLEEEFPFFFNLCRKRLILVIRESNSSHVQANKVTTKRHTRPAKMEELLRDYKYTVEPIITEFGQPLCSIEEGREYLKTFGADVDSEHSAIHRVIRTVDNDYPYYLPYEKRMVMYVIEKNLL